MKRTIGIEFPEGRALRLYVASVVAAGAAGIAAAWFAAGGASEPWLLLLLVLAGAASERFKVGLFGDSHVSLGAVACMVAGIISGPAGIAVVAPPIAVAANLGGRLPLYKTCFNVATYALASLAFLATYRWFGLPSQTEGWPGMVLPATAGTFAYVVVNVGLVAGAVSLASGARVPDVVREHYLWLVPHYLPLGALSAGVAAGYLSAGLWAIPLFVLPLCGAQAALRQYAALRTHAAAAGRRGDGRDAGEPEGAGGAARMSAA